MKNSKMQFAVVLLSTLCLLTSAYGQITGVTAGTDLTGGGTSGNVTLSLNTAKVPQLATANTFTGNQTVNGNLSATQLISTIGMIRKVSLSYTMGFRSTRPRRSLEQARRVTAGERAIIAYAQAAH